MENIDVMCKLVYDVPQLIFRKWCTWNL